MIVVAARLRLNRSEMKEDAGKGDRPVFTVNDEQFGWEEIVAAARASFWCRTASTD
jgi:hypothetical protein